MRPLGSYGGPTQTHALRKASPMIGVIPKSKCHEGGGVDPVPIRRDQRGVKRPQGKRCDIGSFERN
jgi:hypothetical protein